MLARMATGPGARTAAYWLLTAGTIATLGADVGMNLQALLGGGDTTPPWMNLLWQTFYVCIVLAACSESAPRQTCSIGVARWDGAEEPAGLLRRADEALDAAKTGGRNRLAAAPELAGLDAALERGRGAAAGTGRRVSDATPPSVSAWR